MKVIVNLPTCRGINKFVLQELEAKATWVKLLTDKGVRVIHSVSNPNLDTDYSLQENTLYCNCTEELNKNFTLKRYYFIKWAIETNQEFDFLFITSNDTFIHPDRFISLVNEYTDALNIDIAGCVWPYQGWNPYYNFQETLPPNHKDDIFCSGGSGYFLSKKSAQIITEQYPTYTHGYVPNGDDVIFANILKDNNISITHDNRIMVSSPKKVYWEDTFNIGVPYIGDPNSFLCAQHDLDGDMFNIMNKLDLQ